MITWSDLNESKWWSYKPGEARQSDINKNNSSYTIKHIEYFTLKKVNEKHYKTFRPCGDVSDFDVNANGELDHRVLGSGTHQNLKSKSGKDTSYNVVGKLVTKDGKPEIEWSHKGHRSKLVKHMTEEDQRAKNFVAPPNV